MAIGLRTNATGASSIAGYDKDKLISIDTTPSGSVGLCPWPDRIALTFTQSGAPGTLKGRLYWDAAGDYVALSEFPFAFGAGLTTSATITGTATLVGLGPLKPPSSHQTAANKLYLALVPGANTVSVAAGGVELWTHDDTTTSG